MPGPVLTARALGKRFGSRWIFRDLDLEVQERRTVVIMGRSGVGKTVLLKTLSGVYSADAGSLNLNASNAGMLFQKNALFDSMTVEENLLFPLEERLGLTGLGAAHEVERWLRAVGLEGTHRLRPNELSGGMQKRLGIARALAIRPEFVFYDEPTAGLDPVTARLIAGLLLELSREGKMTAVVVTADLSRALQLGDEIHLLTSNGLVAGGTREQLRNSKHPEFQDFMQGPL
jgi:phospholipid/cholesterol/gamma-HCH transport system ATP-binding protein